MSSSYTYTAALSEAEFAEIHVDVVLHSLIGAKRLASTRKLAKAVLVGATIVTALLVYRVVTSWQGWSQALDFHIVLLAVAITLWVFGFLLLRGNTPKRLRQQGMRTGRSVTAFSLRQQHTVTLDEAGFHFEGDGLVSHTAWRHFEEAALGESFLLLIKHDGSVHIVPRRVMGESAAAVTKQCQEWITADGGGAAYAVTALLFDRDVPCPKCQYNLRGQTRPICPECGTTLDQHELHAKLYQAKK